MNRSSRTMLAALVVALTLPLAGCIQALNKDDAKDPAPNGTAGGATTNPPAGNSSAPRVVNEPPVPRITIHNDKDPKNATTRGFKGDVLVLNGTNSTDADGFIVSYEWEIFEPAGGAAIPEPARHSGARVSNIVFGSEGVKIVKLTVTDNLGRNASTSAFYYRDASYSYGDQFHWTGPLTEAVTETREHKLPVRAGAAVVAAHIVVDGAKAEVSLIDPSGTEHVKGATETDNVTIVMDHGLPAEGDWTIKVVITYTPETVECVPVGCAPPVPVAASHDADYGLDGIVWYGEKPAELAAPDDGHGHDH